ncbi:oligosaccharide flippase family protein [Pseudoalteromonas sp. UCD-33C]|uniref:oligosaccharide flippase family protein n=1 Tax=Pseudoalteromonas sp. UCD-33C TaxID=1716175 RepID=UPI0009E87B70|nr:oligosaccharide flippase family protein [Pseudoalteromonas sp. UCD-33C]
MKSKIKALLADKEHRHTLLNTLLALFIRIFGALTAFLFNLIVARELGSERAGVFFLSLAIIMLTSAIARLGLPTTVLRFSSQKSNHGGSVKEILNYALLYSLTLSIFLALLLYVSSNSVAEYMNKPLLGAILEGISPSVIGVSAIFIIAMSLQARHKVFLSIPCQNIVHFMICAFLIVYIGNDIGNIGLLFTSSVTLTALLFYLIAIKKLPRRTNSLDKKLFWDSARANWSITVMNQLIQWLPQLVVGFYLLAESVAFFSVAQRIAMLTTFILMAVNLVVAPKFSAFHAKGDDVGIRKTALFSIRLLVLSALPIVLFMLLFPEFLMGLFGDEFKQGAVILQILVLGQAVNVVTGSVGFLLMMSGHERDMRLVTLISGFGVLISVPIFTKLFGAVGAAVATAFFISLQNLLAVYFVKKRLGFNTLKFWQKI